MQAEWELSQSLTSDGQGIRDACVIAPKNEADEFQLVMGNQGGAMFAFGVPSGALYPISYQHNHSITAIVASPDKSIYVTGCKDATIRVFSSKTHELLGSLTGHQKPVTSLSWAGNGTYLLSGSWDGTAKVWNIHEKCLVATLPGHENSVCVAGLKSTSGSDLRIATGSAGEAQNNRIAGHTVRLWTVNLTTFETTCVHSVANDHEGPIRDITALSNVLATCSNDGTVKLRSLDTGDCLSTLTFLQQTAHPPMLLSVVSQDNDSVAAASAEDGHVVIWGNLEAAGGEPQIILHSACVWNIIALPNGDLATCCQDGTLRIFTKSSDRVAPLAEREQFAQTVQAVMQKQSSGPSAEEIAKLPLWEANTTMQGRSEGQVQLFNKGGIAIAAQWSAASRTWIEVGQVMGSSDAGVVDGVQYDHVLPIEVDQQGGGVAKLQIGYNNGENPFTAAQRFIDAHQLPQYHLSQIADYIQQRVGQQAPTIGSGGGSGGGGSAGPSSTASAGIATTGVPMVSYEHIPPKAYKIFDLPVKSAATTLEKMKTKITEFGKLSDAQLGRVASLMETLVATNRYHASKIQPSELALITDMLKIFPPNEVFPAMDLARMTVLHPDASKSTNNTYWHGVLSMIASLSEKTDGLEGPAAVAIPMLSLRLFTNAFKGGPGSAEAASLHLKSMTNCAKRFVGSKNKNVRLSVATLILNISFYLHSNQSASNISTIAQDVVDIADSILSSKGYEGEGVTRALIALGTVVLANEQGKNKAKQLFLSTKVEMAASPHGTTTKAVAKEVYNVLQ